MICTIYSHYLVFDRIIEILKKTFPKGQIKIGKQSDSSIIEVIIKRGLFSSSKKLRITYRQRNIPSYQLPEIDDSPLTTNLKGLYGFVHSLPANNEKIKSFFLQKILTLNSEFSIQQEQGEIKELNKLIETFACNFDAILFVQPGTLISKSEDQHFLNKNLELILDGNGNSEIDELPVIIDPATFNNQTKSTEGQKARKDKSEKILLQHNIKVNKNLPCIQSDNATILRSSREIAQRICILGITNYVAFNNMSGNEAIEYLKKYNLWDHVTPDEKDFLMNPTDQKKNHETWKCEDIWVLMWSLEKVNKIDFPDKMCNLDDIPYEDYPVGPDKDPDEFIKSVKGTRAKQRILDAADLYYRLDWACVDARLNGIEMTGLIPSVIYERHYALNWLIRYRDQEWDDVSCDT